MYKIIKNILREILYTYYDIFYNNNNSVKLMYYDKNFGDALNPILSNKLTGLKALRVNPKYYKKDNLLMIGSILQMANTNSSIWGAGLISDNIENMQVPKMIYAVRGPLTRKVLLEQNISCPEIYGDPALLIPRVYSPSVKKKYKLGIIPHYVDKNAKWLNRVLPKNVIIIDIIRDNPLEFIDDLLECEKIASSSLHGLIVADAYNIPSTWIKFSDKLYGGNFKFKDYFLSVNRKDQIPLNIIESTTLEEIYENFYEYEIEIDLDLLLSVAPFKIKNSF